MAKYRLLSRMKAGPNDREYLIFEDEDRNLVAVSPDWKYWFPVDYKQHTPLIAVYTVQIPKGKSLAPNILPRTSR